MSYIRGLNKATKFPFNIVSSFTDCHVIKDSHIFTLDEYVAEDLAANGIGLTYPTTIKSSTKDVLSTLENMSRSEFLHALCSTVYDIDKTSNENQFMAGKFTMLI